MLANIGRGDDHQWRNKLSCDGVGLPPLPGLPWFTDAPIFEREVRARVRVRVRVRVRLTLTPRLG